MDIVTHWHILLWIVVSSSIHDLWHWTCDLDIETVIFVYSQLVLKSAFQNKLYSNSLSCNVVQHGIFEHPWSYCELHFEDVCPCQFWVCTNANIVETDRVSHCHIKLCIMFYLVLCLWHWKACPCQLSVINASIFKMDVATLYYIAWCSKITWSILVYVNIYILNDAWENINYT